MNNLAFKLRNSIVKHDIQELEIMFANNAKIRNKIFRIKHALGYIDLKNPADFAAISEAYGISLENENHPLTLDEFRKWIAL